MWPGAAIGSIWCMITAWPSRCRISNAFRDLAWRIRQALPRQGITGADGQEIDHVELFGPPEHPQADGKNFVLCPGRAYDRSPCGTGTSAKLACLAADGKLQPGQVWRQESIVGSIFEGTIQFRDGQVLSAHPRLGVYHRRGNARARSARSVCAWDTFQCIRHTPCADGRRHTECAGYIMTSDVIIVGAGIVGAACARALARDGMRVTIVDAAMIGGGTTAAGMGHVVVMDDNPAQLALTQYSRELWQELADELPEDCEFDSCGTLWVAEDDEELSAAREKQAVLRKHGVCAELLDAQQLAEAEPQLRPGWRAAWCSRTTWSSIRLALPGGWSIKPGRRALRFASIARVVSLGGDHVMLADGTRLAAGCVVNAAGTAAPRLTPGVPIRPRKGHLVITNRYRGFVRQKHRRIGLYQERGRRGQGVGRLQRATAPHGANSHRFVEAV